MILAALAAAALQPATAVTIPPEHRLVEGVASDGKSIFASSALDGMILACKTKCRVLARLPQGLHPLGIAWDPQRKWLWVATDCPKLPGVAPCERGALLALDARGRIRTRIAPLVGDFHPGDVSVGGREVFVSDSSTGAIFRLLPSGRALTALVPPGVGKSGQGSALDAANGRLIAADYSQGIAAIDLATGTRTLLPRQDGKPLRGVDGLVRCGEQYVGIYNGAAPGRLLTIAMRPGGVEYGELIAGLELPDPTQIAFDGKRLLVVANAGWEAAGKADSVRSEGAPILAIPVDADCRPL